MYNQAFSRLIYKDGTGKEVGDMAESWEMAKDGLSFTVKMKQGIKWHDGKEHVAEDYVTMFGYTKDETLLKNAAVKKHQGLHRADQGRQGAGQVHRHVRVRLAGPVHHRSLDYWYAIRIDDTTDPDIHEEAAHRDRPVQDDRVAAQPVRQVRQESRLLRQGSAGRSTS